MMIDRIDASMPEADRARWKLVMTDSYKDIPGIIIEADVIAGTAKLLVPAIFSPAKAELIITTGPHSFKIMPAGRR
jgi:hypothetical protein